MSEALELEIENVWLRLADLPPSRTRTLYLTTDNRISRFQRPDSIEIGTFSRAIDLKDFREEVFFVHGERGRR